MLLFRIDVLAAILHEIQINWIAAQHMARELFIPVLIIVIVVVIITRIRWDDLLRSCIAMLVIARLMGLLSILIRLMQVRLLLLLLD